MAGLTGSGSMNSSDLTPYGFGPWLPFNRVGERTLLEQAPEEPGVYAIRRRTPYPRKRDASDIAYIGSAANQKGLRMRFRQYFHPGHLQRTNLRLIAMVEAADEFEISFVRLSETPEAKYLEAALLEKYKSAHGEYPPENKRRA